MGFDLFYWKLGGLMRKAFITIIASIILTIASPASADYVYIWLRDDTGLTTDKDRGVAKRGEVISIADDSVVPSEKEKENFLIIQMDLTPKERSELLEEWGDPVEDRANWKGKRRLFNVDALEIQLGRQKGRVPGKLSNFEKRAIMLHQREKTNDDLARYRGLVYRRYAGRQLERFINWIDPTRKAYAETETTICDSGCDYISIDNWETTEGAGGTLTEIKTGNIVDDQGVEDCDSGTIDGQTTSASNYMRLYSATGERHAGSETDGASGNGSLLNHNGGGSCINANDEYTRIEWLQIKGNGSTHNQAISSGSTGGKVTIANVIVRDIAIDRAAFRNYNSHTDIMNVLAYDVTGGAGDGCIEAEQGSADVDVYNTTLVNCAEIGFERNNVGSTLDVTNSVACGSGTTDFESDLTSTSQVLSCDATACDSGGVEDTDCFETYTASAIFEDTTNHDYTPKASTDLVDNGDDLVDTPTDVGIDLKGRDRDLEGDTWDIGAIESVVAGGGSRRIIRITRKR